MTADCRSTLIEVLRLVVGVGACFVVPFVAEAGLELGRYVARRRDVLTQVDRLMDLTRGASTPK